MADKNGYAGRVKNSGQQYVQAPFQSGKKQNGTVKRGNDLRNGSGGNSEKK